MKRTVARRLHRKKNEEKQTKKITDHYIGPECTTLSWRKLMIRIQSETLPDVEISSRLRLAPGKESYDADHITFQCDDRSRKMRAQTPNPLGVSMA